MLEHSIRITIPADCPAATVEKVHRLADLHRGNDIAGFVLLWSIPSAIELTAIGAAGVYDRLVKK